MRKEKPAAEANKGTPVRFYLSDSEKAEVDAYLKPLGGKRGTLSKVLLLDTVRSKKQ